jgi:tRNA-specific 2-thiouridylase
MGQRVILAMSGGVDSSVAACLLQEQGYEVIGLFMRTGAEAASDNRTDRKRGCCSAWDAGDARQVADQLGIRFYALDFEEVFNRVIDYFADEYLVGRTPNPCVVCNSWLKFGKLWTYGRELEADWIATGHYARIERQANHVELHQALDSAKDQSYVLFVLKKSILGRILFPLGGLHKEEARALARRRGLPVSEKPDSVEICFVPDNDHAAFIQRRQPDRRTAGIIVDTRGNVLAEHNGLENFTVGQRRGLGIAAGRRRYVLRLVPSTNEVVVGDKSELLTRGLLASNVNWLVEPSQADPYWCLAKIRYRHEPAQALVSALPGSRARVVFTEPQSAVTPGQAVVFYDGTRVLGGGWIDKGLT